MLVGVDIVNIDRIEHLIQRFGDKGLKRFLNDTELALVSKKETAAGFWAAKEAASKAIGTGIGKECSWYDITISKTAKNQPLLSFSKEIEDRYNIKSVSLSISHDGNFAIAVVGISTK
jgi:holo-[acyl-carrier protein] synthase